MTTVTIKGGWANNRQEFKAIDWLHERGFSCHSFRDGDNGPMDISIEPAYNSKLETLCYQYKFNPGSEDTAVLFKLTFGGV